MHKEYIHDFKGRIIGISRQDARNKTVVHDFKTGAVVASYDSKTKQTLNWKTNQTSFGANQAIRFLNGK
jgi:hypothetical protein